MVYAIAANNISSLLNYNTMDMSKHSMRLSSGKRINSAADDAAGLAISQKMRRQYRGLTMARHNVQDGVSLVQTAEGALTEIHDMLQRMNELSVKSANGTNMDEDRAAINKEYKQLITEIDRVADTVEFNELKLLKGSSRGSVPSVPGTAASHNVAATINNQYSTAGNTTGDALAQEFANVIAPNIMNSLRSQFGSLFADFENSSVNMGLRYTTGAPYTAEVRIGYHYWSNSLTGDMEQTLDLSLTLNMSQVSRYWDGTAFRSNELRSEFEAVMAHEMTHALMGVTATRGMTGYGGDRFPRWFGEGMAQAVGGGMDFINNFLSASSSDTQIKNYLNSYKLTASGNQSAYGTGYLAAMYLAWKANGAGSVNATDLSAGYERILKSLADGNSLDTVIQDVLGNPNMGIKSFQNNFHSLTDVSGFVHDLLAATGLGLGALLTGDLAATDLVSNTLPSSTMPLLKIDTNYSRYSNQYPPGFVVMGGGGSYNLDRGDEAVFSVQCGAEANQVIDIHIASMSASDIGSMEGAIIDTEVTTVDSANMAIGVIAGAINQVSDQRAMLGAAQNRLEHTMKSLYVTAENTSDAESRIADADVARELIEVTKYNALRDVASAVLSHVRHQSQDITLLLQS